MFREYVILGSVAEAAGRMHSGFFRKVRMESCTTLVHAYYRLAAEVPNLRKCEERGIHEKMDYAVVLLMMDVLTDELKGRVRDQAFSSDEDMKAAKEWYTAVTKGGKSPVELYATE